MAHEVAGGEVNLSVFVQEQHGFIGFGVAGHRGWRMLQGKANGHCLGQQGANLLRVPGFAGKSVHLALVYRAHDGGQIGIARKQNAHRVRVGHPHFGEQFGARHIGHALVAHQHMKVVLGQQLQRLRTTGGDVHLVLLRKQQTQTVDDALLVVHKEHARAAQACADHSAIRRGSRCGHLARERGRKGGV